MSLFSALNTAVSGLSSQEWAIGNISNNIANSQTVGYKEVNTSFESLVYSNGQFQEPESVAAQSVNTNNISGSIIQSQQATSLAINGSGFFDVKAPPSSTTGGVSDFPATNYYTRRGDFTVNQFGYLVNGSGYSLQGFPVNQGTGALTGSTAAPIQIAQTDASPVATTLMTLVSNLPSNYAPSTTDGTTPNSAYIAPPPTTTTIFDAQGNAHTVDVQFNKLFDATTGTSTWQATITSPDDTSGTKAVFDLAFNTAGTTGDPAGTLQSITADPTNTNAGAAVATGAAANLTIPFTFANGPMSLSLGFGNYDSTLGTTCVASSSGTTPAITTTTNSANGNSPGSLTGLAIDDNGFVNLSYSNGQTVKAFQVAIAQFNAPNQLQSIDGSTFSQTEDSGNPIVTSPGVQGAGLISPSALEQSNVDLATELTQLITAQQAYSSNAKVITTANQMLQTVTNLIQG